MLGEKDYISLVYYNDLEKEIKNSAGSSLWKKIEQLFELKEKIINYDKERKVETLVEKEKEYFYQDGYSEGHGDGYDEGYSEGFKDGLKENKE